MEPFGIQVAIYLFLAGLAAGAGFWGSFSLTEKGGRRSVDLALICAVIGSLFLVLDLTRPQDFLLVLTEANTGSAISWGARILVVFLLAGVFVRVASRDGTAVKGLDAIGLWLFRAAAVGLALYPGFVLKQGEAYGLWQHGFVIPLIAVSAFHAGILLPRIVGKDGQLSSVFTKVELSLGVLQVLLLAGVLLNTKAALPVWLFALVLGTLVPFALAVTSPQKRLALRFGLSLLGLFAVRHWLVMGGQVV